MCYRWENGSRLSDLSKQNTIAPCYSQGMLPRFVLISRNSRMGPQTPQGTVIILTCSHRDKTLQPSTLMRIVGVSFTAK